MKTIFNTVRTALLNLSRYVAIAMTATSLTACVMEDGAYPAVSADNGIGVSLEITGGLPAASTRAEEEGSLAESYIDINDLYVFSFDLAEGETVASDNAVLKDIIWSPDQSGRLEESVISSNGTDVIITTFLDSEKYSEKNLDFCIVTVANASKWMEGSTFYSDLKTGETTLRALQKILNYDNVVSSGNDWAPDNKTGSGIPLFGIRKVNLSKYDTHIYNAANPYPLGTVWLLRSLAKIEISTDADSGLEIEQAWIESWKWNTGLQLIPSPLSRMENYDTAGETAQVTTSPNFDAHEFNPDPAERELIFIKDEENGSHVVYLPEYDLSGNPQIIKLKIKGFTDTFSLSVSPYSEGYPAEGTEPYWECILRNHLYRFEITGIEKETSLSINWTVCPMDEKTIDIPPFN